MTRRCAAPPSPAQGDGRPPTLEEETGSIEAGKAADLIVLSHDILSCPPQEIVDAEVEPTLFAGRPTYAGRHSLD